MKIKFLHLFWQLTPRNLTLSGLIFLSLCSYEIHAGTPAAPCIAMVKNHTDVITSATDKKCPLASQLVDWMRLVDGLYHGSFAEGVTLVKSQKWPRLELLHTNLEGLISANTPAQDVVSWFTVHKPKTGTGAYYYLNALSGQGKKASLASSAKDYWIRLNFQAEDEVAFIKAFGSYLTSEDHWKRTERLLWDERAEQALRMVKRLPRDKALLTHARVHLIQDLPGVEGAIAQVPKAHTQNEGLWFDRTKWRRIRQLDNAGDYLLKTPPKNSKWATYWAKERIAIARELIQNKRYTQAYTLLSQHGLTQGTDYAEAQWLAGWLALRFVKKPQQALALFSALYGKVSTPMSKGRAAYWAAEACRALKMEKEKKEWLLKAAQYSAHFYGQLAHKKLYSKAFPGLTNTPLVSPQKQAFSVTPEAQMTLLLIKSDQEKYLKIFLEHLAENLSPMSRRCLLDFLETHGHRFTVLAARKMARFQTLLVPEAYPNLCRFTKEKDQTSCALTHAVIRQESSFDPKATSGSGAMGLMQLVSGTAKEVAKKLNIKFGKTDLHNRPALNVRLGRHYLHKLLKKYDGSYPVALAAYNAGPGNLSRWLNEVGDPRQKNVDLIDWIEQLPFSETRDYVHRVMENHAIYLQLLQVKPNPQSTT